MLKIHVFDVGHGDSIVIEFPGGKNFGLIDFNRNSEKKVFSFFEHKLKLNKSIVIEFICLTHYHLDHFNGLGEIIQYFSKNNVEIKEFWDPGVSKNKFKAWKKLYEKHGNPLTKSNIDEIISYATSFKAFYPKIKYVALTHVEYAIKKILGTKIDILAPYCNHWDDYNRMIHQEDHFNSDKEHINCSALILKYKKRNILLAGDINNDGWDELINEISSKDIKIDFLKVSHHGSNNGNYEKLYSTICNNNTPVVCISGGYRSDIRLLNVLAACRDDKAIGYCTGNFMENSICKSELNNFVSPDCSFQISMESNPVNHNNKTLHGNITYTIDSKGQIKIETEHKFSTLNKNKNLINGYLDNGVSFNYN